MNSKHANEKIQVGPSTASYNDLRDLTLAVSLNSRLHFKDGAVRILLQAIFDRVWELEEERDFWKVLPKEQSLMISYSDKKLTMKIIRRVAYRLGVSLSGLLAGEIEGWTGQLDPRWLQNLPSNLVPMRRRRKHDRKALVIKLAEIRASCDASKPPSLAEVAKQLGISTGGMEYIFPAISSEIKFAYQELKKEERRRKKEQARMEVNKYLASSIRKKSRKHAMQLIREKTGLPKNLLISTMSELFHD